MACEQCGAKNGHYAGCKHCTGKKQGRKPKPVKEPDPPKTERTCSGCGGTGTNARTGNTCSRCGGTGRY